MKKIICALIALCFSVCAFSACKTDGEQLDKLPDEPSGHNCAEYIEKQSAVASSCYEHGHKLYYECAECGKLYSDSAAKNQITAESVVLPYAAHNLEFCNEQVGEYTDFYYCTSCKNYFEDKSAETAIPSDKIDQYGRLIVQDTYAWIGYPASEYTLEFTAQEESVTYEYDVTKLMLDTEAKTVKALAVGEYTVTVTSKHHGTSFKVICKTVDRTTTDSRWQVKDVDVSRASYLNSEYKLDGKNGKTTLFIGDSFFDDRYFFTNFSFLLKGKDAICAGISSTTTYDWENFMLNKTFLTGIAPKNIVMNMGTNNFYDDHDLQDLTIENLQRMFTLMHSLMPDTNIYYFSIAQRTVRTYNNEVSETNNAMQAWCEYKSWITFIDVEDKMTENNLRDDGVHPILEAYQSVYLSELEQAGCIIE